jgi:prepilin-type N-terminal cleavage/methylation domain-containing protein
MGFFQRREQAIHDPRGVTMVELLVTISILLIILGFLLPVLVSARESARRAGCMNNLAQIGKAVNAYDSNQGSLPGWRMSLPGYTDVTGNNVSWAITILPYLDAMDLYDWFRTQAAGVATLDDVRKKRLPRYACPTIVSEAKTLSPLSYMGNGGTGAEVIRADGNQYRGDGVFLDNVGSGTYTALTHSLSTIGARDGTSGTMMMTERAGMTAPLTVSWADAPVAAVLNANAVATTHLILHPPALGVGATPPIDKRVINPSSTTTISAGADWNLRYPSSRHASLACAVFCDGRTQSMSETIAPWVYCQILTSDRRTQSPRAAAWEVYPVSGAWVRYVFDEKDLNPKK